MGLTKKQRDDWDRYVLSVRQGKDARIESEGRKSAVLGVAADYEVLQVKLVETKRRLDFEIKLGDLMSSIDQRCHSMAKIELIKRFTDNKLDSQKTLCECQELYDIDNKMVTERRDELAKQFPDLYLAEFGNFPNA
jgi:hypothetical protein